MAQIVSKLNLNKTPALVESNSLIFAKNIRLDVDGTLHRDYGVFPLSIVKTNSKYINHTNIINRIISDINKNKNISSYYSTIYEKLIKITDKNKGTHKIVGVIPNSNEFFLFINGSYKLQDETIHIINCIIRYDEKEDKFHPCNCNWSWSGGTIDGCVINNLIGDKILNIGEYNTIDLVPFKSINLNTSSIDDDESIYTQIPNVPLTNLRYADTLSYVIPNGVYQFFVRYRISDNFYTDWFLVSNEIFVGNKNNVITSYGTLNYVNTHRDSDNSFVLSVEHLLKKYQNNYKDYQIGFILSHDDATYARAWKHFKFDVETINFDYKASDAEEIEVVDMLKSTYALFNVGNITSFKNKLYISNYTESEFNDTSLQKYADDIDIKLAYDENAQDAYDGNPAITTIINGKPCLSGIKDKNTNIEHLFNGINGIFYDLLNYKFSDDNITIIEAIKKSLNNEEFSGVSWLHEIYGINVSPIGRTLSSIQYEFRNKYNNYNDSSISVTYNVQFPNKNINKVTVNGKEIKDITVDNVISAIYNQQKYLNTECNFIDISGKVNESIIINITRTAEITTTTTIKNSGNLGVDNVVNDEIIDTDDNGSSLNKPITKPSVGGNQTTTTKSYKEYDQTFTIRFSAKKDKYTQTDVTHITNKTTLIPYQKYKFYIHFVKASGEITNGYYCSKAGELEAPYMKECNSIIYPIFDNIEIPNGYEGCFFSICHTAINSSTIFNIKDDPNDRIKEGSCFDINMMLVPGNKKIHIRQGITSVPSTSVPDDSEDNKIDKDDKVELENNDNAIIYEDVEVETFNGEYHYSSDPSVPRYFGADGIITFDKEQFKNEKLAYAINDYSISNTEIVELIKCTPYINSENTTLKESTSNKLSYSDYKSMNLLGYICSITPLLREVCITYYSDGTSVYYKEDNSNNVIENNESDSLKLTELSKYQDASIEKRIAGFYLKSSNNVFVYSNYNLNYVTLSEEPKMRITTYYNRSANTSGSASESQLNDSSTIILRLLSSQLMSDVYSLPSMYKEYVKKTYSTYTNNSISRFDNTVRSSVLYGDEDKVNVLKFEANDYYNVPTNRGIITNLISVGDAILVHTQDSMFKFSGSNNIQASEGEILTTESKPFDTGVSEVFGSDFGFAGLQNKSDHIVTENGYIFFDRDSRIIYLYSGQGQIVKISDSVEKLFRYKDIYNITFANDFYNNRFFVSILFYDTYTEIENDKEIIKEKFYPVTLSFNITENAKAFISLHDFYYYYAFNTKTKCYFVTTDNRDICSINKEYKGCYTKLALTEDVIYPQLNTFKSIYTIEVTDDDYLNTLRYDLKSYASVLDIISNEQFETIKTLNAINWCGTKIISEFKEIDSNNPETLRMAEDICYDIPCKAIRIYTDTCMSPLMSCTNKSNDYSISSLNNYKYPRYNQGIWTLNYFRNILNSKNHTTASNYSSDDNSLIEGKYFVVRFVFDDDFKFETLTFNYNIKQ